MFKVNNKDTETTTFNKFQIFFIADFEQVNVW